MVVVAHEILVSAQGPLVFVFLFLGLRGLGPGLDNYFIGHLSTSLELESVGGSCSKAVEGEKSKCVRLMG